MKEIHKLFQNSTGRIPEVRKCTEERKNKCMQAHIHFHTLLCRSAFGSPGKDSNVIKTHYTKFSKNYSKFEKKNSRILQCCSGNI